MRICVAVSGGVDSVCLLHAFKRESERLEISLSALHCEHGIRGESSLSDCRFVQKFCTDLGIPLRVFSESIPARSAVSGRGLEEEGRAFRYECFEKVLQTGVDFVATAHHKGDVAETVLFRLARGTSLKGLSAIRERDGIIRPLLNITREEIEAYATENAVPFVTDESNADERYARNAIRSTVLPALENAVSGAAEHLVSFASRAMEDDDFLQSLARNELIIGDREIKFKADLPAPVFSRACLSAMHALGITQDYTAANVKEIAALKSLQSGRKASLPSGVEAAREGEYIAVYRPTPPTNEEIQFTEGRFRIGDTAVEISADGEGLFADLNAFPNGCVIRTRREGDRFTPFKGREKSLKEYFTDKKIPARKGWNMPLVAKGNTVYAIFGVEISDGVKITEQTQKRVRLRIIKEGASAKAVSHKTEENK